MFPSRGLALDVGAGSGRDARWLRSLGMSVVAVEPAAGFRRHASANPDDDIRWVDDRLPSLDRVHRLGLGFDLILLSAVWQHVAPADRQRSFRKLATLLKPGGVLAITLRSGPSPSDRPMHATSAAEVEGLARSVGLEILKVETASDLQGRADVTWSSVAMRMPDDGTSALPLIRGIVLGDDKSSTYKLGLLRAVARVAEHAPGAVAPVAGQADAVDLPLGLVALFWIRMYLPLVRLGLPQAPNNRGPDGLGFAKNGFRRLLADGVDASDLRVGAVFDAERGSALVSALSEAASTIASMPANFTRFPNSDRRVFEVVRGGGSRAGGLELTVAGLRRWGAIVVPGGLWRALSRHGPWIDPMLVAEWARLTRGYADRMSIPVETGIVEAALEWREPIRTTAIARLAADRILAEGRQIECVWTGRPLSSVRLDVDHCLPWAAWPCGDLWNLGPCDSRVNRHEKRDRLPSAALLSQSRERIMRWWQDAYLSDPALAARFGREALGSLPVSDALDAAEVFAALDWRRLRLAQDQQLPEWSRQLQDVT
ncbi:methyltransferase domain-containing protein [Sphingomonas yabuuchiae]|uniref:methyltransferase domain-containing protein n=1 Tax=Sphingomonas yabuuchiae TaxID=172044 RepID=UPI00160D7828|nr:methyltransferase domain-containing protein [Sphingomonas yabuuchiae]